LRENDGSTDDLAGGDAALDFGLHFRRRRRGGLNLCDSNPHN
jgi:hypothetical protein